MSIRLSTHFKGVGLSLTLTTIVKVLFGLLCVGLLAYFTAYPTHAATLFDDDFEGNYNGEWYDVLTANCERGVVLSTDYASHGVWSLSADRTGAAPNCTEQYRSELGIYDQDIVQVSFSVLATETNISRGSVYFSDSEDPFVEFGGVKISSEDIVMTGGTVVKTPIVDATWYRVDYRVDFTTGCQTARVDGGAWATPECGITATNLAHLQFGAVGTISTVLYLDNVLLSTYTSGVAEGVLPPEFDYFLGTEPADIGDIISGYPSHDDIYGTCSIWAGIFLGSSGDGMACIWSWIQYAVIPENESLSGLLATVFGTLTTRWPFSYISAPITTITENFHNDECPLPVFLGQEFMGTTLPEFDLCTLIDDAGYADYMLANIWAEAMIIYAIYVGAGYMLYKRAEQFLTGD